MIVKRKTEKNVHVPNADIERKSYKMKNKIFLILFTLLLIAGSCISCEKIIDIKTPGEYYCDGDEADTGEEVSEKVKLTVDCTSIMDGDGEHIPDDGYLIKDFEIALEEGDTAYTVLQKAAKKYTIVVDASQGYVSGIGGIYSGDFGDMSGWTYYVNGESPSVGADMYELGDGDVVKWVYIEDFSSLWG